MSDDERRMIADAFRAAAHSDLDGTTFQRKTKEIVFPEGAPEHSGWRNVFIRLAELIDPAGCDGGTASC